MLKVLLALMMVAMLTACHASNTPVYGPSANVDHDGGIF